MQERSSHLHAALVSELRELCKREGATPDRIAVVAPVLQGLSVTSDALRVLGHENDDDGFRPLAAHLVLDCVSRQDGSFSDQFFAVIRTCLGLDGEYGSLTQREAQLVEKWANKLPSSRTTFAKHRGSCLTRLAWHLMALQAYPCSVDGSPKRAAVGTRSQRDDLAILLQTAGLLLEWGGAEEEFQRTLLREVEQRIPGAFDLIEEMSGPTHLAKAWNIILTAITARSYRDFVDATEGSGISLLLGPLVDAESLRRILSVPAKSSNDLQTFDVPASVYGLAAILMEIEARGEWRAALVAQAQAVAWDIGADVVFSVLEGEPPRIDFSGDL